MCCVLVDSAFAQQTNDCFESPFSNDKNLSFPCTVVRFTEPFGENQVKEHLYPITRLDMHQHEQIDLRICSNDVLLLSISRASVSPFEILKQLRFLYGNKQQNIFVSRYSDCEKGDSNLFPLEVVVSSAASSLPEDLERYDIQKIEMKAMNVNFENCRISNYEKALRKAQHLLEANKGSFVVAIGYFVNKPSPTLRRNMDTLRHYFTGSMVDNTKFASGFRPFSFDISGRCTDSQLSQPAIFYLGLKSK